MSGYVYVVEALESGRVKIGYSARPKIRFSALQTASPEKLRLVTYVEAGRDLEAFLHDALSEHHVRGEWFSDLPTVKRILSECRKRMERLDAYLDREEALNA